MDKDLKESRKLRIFLKGILFIAGSDNIKCFFGVFSHSLEPIVTNVPKNLRIWTEGFSICHNQLSKLWENTSPNPPIALDDYHVEDT